MASSIREVAAKSFSERLDEAKRVAAAAAIKNRRSKSKVGSKHGAVPVQQTRLSHDSNRPQIVPKKEKLEPTASVKIESKKSLSLSEIPLRPVNKYSELKIAKKRKRSISNDGGPSSLPLSSSLNSEEASTAGKEHTDPHLHPFAPAKRSYRKKAPSGAT